MFTLDARSFRDAELVNANPTNPADVGRFLTQAFDPSRTMLGASQLADLKVDLLAAQRNGVTWKFVMVPEPIQNLGPLGAADRFEGYAAERTEILKFVKANGIANVVFVAADIHGTLVNNLSYQDGPFPVSRYGGTADAAVRFALQSDGVSAYYRWRIEKNERTSCEESATEGVIVTPAKCSLSLGWPYSGVRPWRSFECGLPFSSLNFFNSAKTPGAKRQYTRLLVILPKYFGRFFARSSGSPRRSQINS